MYDITNLRYTPEVNVGRTGMMMAGTVMRCRMCA